ncbi:MAG: winged helix-turn-helix transcriptional regulator [Acidimicrobiales bacterium]|nr:winged helix-turn-helix transcriptional regulator [Acidimicrobiales bacterium]
MALNASPALDAVGEPTRRRILDLLRSGPTSVTDLAAELPVSRPAVSQHLARLQDAGLVRCSVRGRHHLYALRSDGFEAIRDYADSFWSDALARFRVVAESLEAG